MQADARQIPFADGSFDIVLDSWMTQDMADLQGLDGMEIRKAEDEMQRVLRHDALLCTTPHRHHSPKFKEVYSDGGFFAYIKL